MAKIRHSFALKKYKILSFKKIKTQILFNILDLKPEIRNSTNAKEVKITKGEIIFSDIEMKFGEKSALEKINLKII